MLIQYLKSFIEVITINIIEFLKGLWRKKQEDVSTNFVNFNSIVELLDGLNLDYYEIIDDIYKTSDYLKIKEAAKLVPVRFQAYSKDHDCDNYAIEYMAVAKRMFPQLPVGIVHVEKTDGQRHALNFVITATPSNKLTWDFIEPQTGKMFMDKNYKPYFVII